MSQDARRDEELATQRRAQILQLSYIDTSRDSTKPLYRQLLTNQELYSLKVIPISADDHQITFGITNTTSQTNMTQLKQRFMDQRVSFALISDSGFRDFMKLYDPPKEVTYHDISLSNAGSESQVEKVSTTLEQVNASDMLAYLVEQAHRLGASDIHLEPQTDHANVRFRIDGVLHPIAKIGLDKYRVLIAAIASAGNVSTSAKEAQQGHITQTVSMENKTSVEVNVRLETVSSINGMEVVMRLFNMDQSMYSLDRLGLSAQERQVVDDIINRPSGLVLVVGPTGSGKTTTLYSMLNSLSSPERKIITIEDPVEYQLSGVTQISVNSQDGEATFADKLRAVLRLDPDTVMVGEIRDSDTARTALQAALTGHLVLSTFHASSAAAALSRLAEIIGQNPLFVSSIRLVMAQRLVRRLDDNSKQSYKPDEAMLQRIRQVIESLPEGIERPALDDINLYKPSVSPENPYGFKGQLALREQFLMVGQVETLLSSNDKPTTQEIEAAAIASGMRTMLQDGILKVLAGETTLEEIYRVIG